MWKLVRHDVDDAEDDGFGIVDKSAQKKKEKINKKIVKKVISHTQCRWRLGMLVGKHRIKFGSKDINEILI